MDNPTAGANIFVNPQVPTPVNKKLDKRIIYLSIGLVVLVGIILAAKGLIGGKIQTSPVVPATVTSTAVENVVESPSGTLVLESPSAEYKVGDAVPVVIKLDTGGRPTSGTDVVLKYNPSSLEASGSSIIQGTIYPDYPLAKADPGLKTIRISGLSSSASTDFSGIGDLARIDFKAKALGKTALIIDFTPGATADSNILETLGGTDWLKSVTNLEVTIK